MLKIWLSLVLIYVLVFTAAPVLAGSSRDKQAQTDAQIKAKIARLGVGRKARVTIRLKNGTKLRGYIEQAGENEFVLKDKDTGAPVRVLYEDVARVEDNRGRSVVKNIAIGTGIIGGIILACLALGYIYAGN
jgi:hypothetical protein